MLIIRYPILAVELVRTPLPGATEALKSDDLAVAQQACMSHTLSSVLCSIAVVLISAAQMQAWP